MITKKRLIELSIRMMSVLCVASAITTVFHALSSCSQARGGLFDTVLMLLSSLNSVAVGLFLFFVAEEELYEEL